MPSVSNVERVERVAEGGHAWSGRNALDAPEVRVLMLALYLHLLRHSAAGKRVEDSTAFEDGDFEGD